MEAIYPKPLYARGLDAPGSQGSYDGKQPQPESMLARSGWRVIQFSARHASSLPRALPRRPCETIDLSLRRD